MFEYVDRSFIKQKNTAEKLSHSMAMLGFTLFTIAYPTTPTKLQMAH